MADYIDNSYAPVGTGLSYIRGDGARVTIRVEPPTTPAPPRVPAPVPTLSPTAQLYVPPTPTVATSTGDVFDHPAIGGKFTIFVLLYGPSAYHPMHRRCLESIIGSVPPGRMDLRVGSNQLCKESVSYVQDLLDRKLVTKHYQHATNDKKYPVMREMFHDPNLPIDTKWLLWFDDDSIADRNPAWLSLLAAQIVAGVDHNCHMYGAKFVWTLQAGQANWMRSRPWYRARPFRAANGRPSPNGDKIIFVAGGFWALSTEAMRACNIPDEALGHNGGDYTIGEQLWQGGYDLKAWNGQKQFIHTSSVPRRGLNETHIGIQPKTRVVT
jgi:hypothetical protein